MMALILAAGLGLAGAATPAPGDCPPLFPGAQYPAGDGPRSVATGDLNGDQVPDLAVGNRNRDSGGVSILLNLCPTAGNCLRDPEWQCDGDVDGDGQVNPVDSGLIQAAYGSVGGHDLCQYDLDCNGVIDPIDSGIVQALFGTCEEPRDVCP